MNMRQRNIVAIPEDEVLDQVLRWSENCSEFGKTEFKINPNNALAHMSLYQTSYPDESDDRLLIDTITPIAALTTPFLVIMHELSTFWGTFLFWDAQKTGPLVHMHKRLMEALNPLRRGRIAPAQQQMLDDENVPEDQKENIRQFGYPLAAELFQPHITITRFKEPADAAKAQDALRSSKAVEAPFTLDKIYMAEVGPHGTCPKILHEFQLGKA